jgi:hypothetical protein
MAVKYVDHIHVLNPFLRRLGEIHALLYHVRSEHYATVGEALLWTLEAGMGKEVFTAEVKDAWTWAYGLIAETMSSAGEAARLSRLVAQTESAKLAPATPEQPSTQSQPQQTERETSILEFSGYKGHHNK